MHDYKNELIFYGNSQVDLLKTFYLQDDKITHPYFLQCSECNYYHNCKPIWDHCGKDTCVGCKKARTCDGNMNCKIDGGYWVVKNEVERPMDLGSFDIKPTKENIMDQYFGLLAEDFDFTILDISDKHEVDDYAKCFFDDYPHEPLPLFYDFFLSISDYTSEVDEIVCFEYVKGTDYPEALIKAIPGDTGQALSKIGFNGEGYVMVLRSDYRDECGRPASECEHFSNLFFTDLFKKIDGIQDFHGYLDKKTYAFVVEDTFTEEIPGDVLDFLRKYCPDYPNRP